MKEIEKEEKKMKRRCMAVLLCLVMLFGLFPAAAQAAEVVDSGTCGVAGNEDSVTWELDSDGVLEIHGTGAMEQAMWSDTDSVRSVVIDEGITEIFSIGGSVYVTTVSIPSSVTFISEVAFSSYPELEHIYYAGTKAQFSDFHVDLSGLITTPIVHCTDGDISGSAAAYTVTFNPNGGTGSAYTQTVTAGQAATLTPNTFTREGYSFNGWNTAADGSGTPYTDGASVTLTGDLTLYAQWEQSGQPNRNILDSGYCGAEGNEENVTWTLTSDGTLTIGGTGAMADYDPNFLPWNHNGYFDLITNVVIESGVTSIGDSMFQICSNLERAIIPDSVITIGNSAFANCGKLTNIDIPDSVTSIGNNAFSYCTSITNITLPDSVIHIGVHAFGSCSSLANISVPDSITSIERSTFEDCSSLTSVTISNTLSGVSSGAFSRCFALEEVYYGGTQTQWSELESNGIDNGDNRNIHLLNSTIHCIDGIITGNVRPDSLPGYCGAVGNRQNVQWTLNNGTLTISGTGEMANYYINGESPWDQYRESITEVVIEQGVTSIGGCAFLYCTNLENVSIPAGITTIEYAAFEYCSSLTNITIPYGVTTIREGMFGGCANIISVIIPDSVTTIETSAFEDCVNLSNISIPNSVTSIEDYTFSNCTSLTNVIIPNGIASIEHSTFNNCTRLTSVTIPSSVTLINNGAFMDCVALIDVYYGGTQAQWSTLASSGIESQNEPLLNAIIHFAENTSATVTITTQTIPEAVQYIPFAVPLECTVSGGTSPDVMWQISSGSLPDGVTLSERGVLSGAAKNAGVFPFTVTAAAFDSGVQPASASFTLTVKPVSEADWETVISDGYEILDRIPDMYKYEDHTFRVAGPLSEFQSFYLDGNPLTAVTDYTTEEGSTRINIPAATFQTAGEGTHTVAAVFDDGSGALRVSAQNYIADLSGNMQKLTFGVNEYDTAVQYVPFSAVINAVPMYGDLRFEIVDRGNLPADWEQAPGNWSLNPESGEITGVPQTAGTEYQFVVGVKHGDNGEVFDRTNVKITVMDNTRTNVTQETDPGFQVITPIPDMYEATVNQLFVSQGEYELFTDFYLDGKKLTRDEEYTAESGSTRITVFSQVLRALGVGEHTAAATFVVHKKDGTSQTKVSSQNFSTGVQPVRSSGGGGSRSSGYAITLKQTTGGTVKSSNLSARSGAKVTLTLTPSAGYQVQSVRVAGTTGSDSVTVTRNGNQFTFTMPSKAVTVTPAFTRFALRVAPVSADNGKVSVSKSSAVPGTSVTITAHPDNGYVAAAFSAWDKDGKYLTVKDNGDGTASFTMPDSPVQVGARFELDPGLPVTDIASVDWFYEDARWAYRRGILRGVTGTLWVPEDRMSTATAVVTLARLAGADLTEYQDVNWSIREDSGSYGWIPAEWYAPEARWAAVNNILTEDIFTGREALPRAYLAVMLRRFLTQQGVVAEALSEQTVFSDADAVRTFGPDAEEAFQVLYQADVFRGDSSKAMLPGAYTKRSHLAATLHRLSDFIIGYWEERSSEEQDESE